MRDLVKDIWAGPSCYSGSSLLFPEPGRVDKEDLGIQRWTGSSFPFGGSLSLSPLFSLSPPPSRDTLSFIRSPCCIGGNGWRVTTSHRLTTLYSSHMRAQIALVCRSVTVPSSYGLGLHMLKRHSQARRRIIGSQTPEFLRLLGLFDNVTPSILIFRRG